MNSDPKLAEMLGAWDPGLPVCEKHAAAPLAGFCTECGKPVCADCVILSTAGIRCIQCVPAWQAGMKPSTREALRAMHSFVTARRTIAAWVALAAFVATVALFPALLRPSAYKPPATLTKAGFRAPFLEKAHRLRSAGDTMAEAGYAQHASAMYRRAEEACRRHLSEAKVPSDLEPIIQLGLGRLLEKQGAHDKALETFRGVIAAATDAPPARVASFYVGRILETAKGDPQGAIASYRYALAGVPNEGDTLNAIIDYTVAEQENKAYVYAVAALLDTTTHPRGIRTRLEKAIERLTGSPPGEAADRSRRPPAKSEAEETFEIVLGR